MVHSTDTHSTLPRLFGGFLWIFVLLPRTKRQGAGGCARGQRGQHTGTTVDVRQAGLQDTLDATRLKAAGVGSGLRSRPQRDDFIRRALDVVFRGQSWHFFVQSTPAWQIEDGFKVLQRLRITAAVADRFSWVSGPLVECLS